MNLENKKYGEFIIKVPQEKIEIWEEALKIVANSLESYEIKLYDTHFKKYLKKEN